MRGAVELGHQLSVRGSGCLEVFFALGELVAELGDLLFKVVDLPLEGVGVGGSAEASGAPGILAKGFGQALFEAGHMTRKAGLAFSEVARSLSREFRLTCGPLVLLGGWAALAATLRGGRRGGRSGCGGRRPGGLAGAKIIGGDRLGEAAGLLDQALDIALDNGPETQAQAHVTRAAELLRGLTEVTGEYRHMT